MSFEAERLVWEHSRAQGDALLVLALLAFQSNKDHRGVSWSKVDSLAERTRLRERQLQRAVAQAAGLGELYVHVVHGRGRTNAYMVTCGRTRAFVAEALVDILGLSVDVAEKVAARVSESAGKGVTGDGFSEAKKVSQVTGFSAGKGVNPDTYSTPEKVTPVTPFEALSDGKGDTGDTFCNQKGDKWGEINPSESTGKGVTGVVPPLHPPIRKNHEENHVRENHRRRRVVRTSAGAPARIDDDDDDFLELILGEFERQTGRTRKPADEVAARTLHEIAFESVRRGIAKSVAAVGDGRVSSLRYCVPAIQEFERARAQAQVGAAPRPVAVPDPDPELVGADELERPASEYSESDKKPVWEMVEKFLKRSASMHGRVPDRGEIRAHLILERGFDPGLIEAMYPTGNGSSKSSPSQVITAVSTAKE